MDRHSDVTTELCSVVTAEMVCMFWMQRRSRPHLLGQLKFMPHSQAIWQEHVLIQHYRCRVVISVCYNEGERFQFFPEGSIKEAQAMNNLHMVDVSDPTHPTLIAEFPYPEVPEDFPYPNFNVMNLGCQVRSDRTTCMSR